MISQCLAVFAFIDFDFPFIDVATRNFWVGLTIDKNVITHKARTINRWATDFFSLKLYRQNLIQVKKSETSAPNKYYSSRGILLDVSAPVNPRSIKRIAKTFQRLLSRGEESFLALISLLYFLIFLFHVERNLGFIINT